MAYEAMNNAAETTKQLIVILNDNDMSIAPPVGGMSAYLARLVSGGAYRSLRKLGKTVAEHLPAPAAARRPARPRNTPAAWSPAAPSSRSWASTTSARSTATTWTHLVRVLKNAARDRRPAGAGPRRHPEGQGLRARPRTPPTSTTAWSSSTWSPASRPRRQPARRSYTKVFAQELIKQAETRPEDRGDHRRHAVGHRPRPVRPRLPRAHLRRRHRRAACGDLRRRPGRRRHEAVLRRSIRPSCSAATTRWSTTWPSRACRCASPSTAPAWSAPTARPTPARSTSATWARCPAWC